jgi:imidazoleglycerol-phosphate dehydratase
MKIAFVLTDGFSNFEFAALFEPLARLHRDGLLPDLQWDLCALTDTVSDQNGMRVTPTCVRQPLSGYDLLVIPGGALGATEGTSLVDWLKSAADAPMLAASGNATLLLAAAGLLQGKPAAATPETAPALQSAGAAPQTGGVVEAEGIFTAAGAENVAALGLRLAEKLAGAPAAEQVRRSMGLPVSAGDMPLTAPAAAREAHVSRKTRETSIDLKLSIDGSGQHSIDTGVGFFDHMLTQIAVHGLFDLELKALGDLHIDPHHTVEDVGLALGDALRTALGDRRGITRTASSFCPMDESLARTAVDLSGRPYSVFKIKWGGDIVGGMPVSLMEHFLESFALQGRFNLHIEAPYGRDTHHQAEAIFKSLARALDAAARYDPRRTGAVPSSKGILF